MKIDVHAHSWYHQKHHNPSGGFFNLQETTRNVSPARAGKWLLHHYTRKNKKQNVPAPVVDIDIADLHQPPDTCRVTWLGHATTLIQMPDITILLDPVFSDRCSPFRFAGPCREPGLPLSIEELPPIDIVLITHDHYDHLDKKTITHLSERFSPTVLVPLGVNGRLNKWGVKTGTELDWWQYIDVEKYRIHCTPARHFSGRGILDRNSTLWCGWFIQPKDDLPSVFYAGDTAYADHFSNMTLHLQPPDVAILPIGAYRPRWFMGHIHMNPRQAWQAFRDLQASVLIPVHWGTFDLAQESLSEPIEELRANVAENGHPSKLADLAIGESYTWHHQIA